MKLHGEALRDIIGMVPLLYLIRGTDSSYNRDKGTIHLIYAFLYIYDTAQRFSHGYTNGIPFIDNTGQIHQCLFIYMLQMIRLLSSSNSSTISTSFNPSSCSTLRSSSPYKHYPDFPIRFSQHLFLPGTQQAGNSRTGNSYCITNLPFAPMPST